MIGDTRPRLRNMSVIYSEIGPTLQPSSTAGSGGRPSCSEGNRGGLHVVQRNIISSPILEPRTFKSEQLTGQTATHLDNRIWIVSYPHRRHVLLLRERSPLNRQIRLATCPSFVSILCSTRDQYLPTNRLYTNSHRRTEFWCIDSAHQ